MCGQLGGTVQEGPEKPRTKLGASARAEHVPVLWGRARGRHRVVGLQQVIEEVGYIGSAVGETCLKSGEGALEEPMPGFGSVYASGGTRGLREERCMR